MIYAVVYDLKQPNRNYAGLYGAIKARGSWWHYPESCWLTDTKLGAESIFQRLRPHLDSDDRALVVEIGLDRQGWLPKAESDWINQRLTPA